MNEYNDEIQTADSETNLFFFIWQQPLFSVQHRPT